MSHTDQATTNLTSLAAALTADTDALGPALPAYHWASAVADRGWEQPRLDGGNGAEWAGTFCRPEGVTGRLTD